MLDEEFLKERQDIREKMLRYSRAIKKGQVPQEIFDENEDILKRRVKKDKRPRLLKLEDEPKSTGNIYLKEDLINVKLEDKKNFLQKLFAKRKKNKNEKNLEKKLALNNASQAPKKEGTAQAYKENFKKEFKKEGGANTLNSGAKSAQGAKNLENFERVKSAQNTQNIKSTPNAQNAPAPKIEPQNKAQKPQIKPQENLTPPQTAAQTKLQNKPQAELKTELQTETQSEEKQNLLQGFEKDLKADRNLSFNQLIFSFLLVFFACAIFVPQIYIRNNIYYLSREIAILRSQESVLNEENKQLKRELENLRFKNQILDYLE